MKRNGTLLYECESWEMTSERELFCFDLWDVDKTTDQYRPSRITL